MLYLHFAPSLITSQLLEDLQRARDTLDRHRDAPDAYMGNLRRHAVAASAHYSTRIEGNALTLQQVESLLQGRQISAPADQQQEVLNYHEAMRYAQSVAASPSPRLSEDTIRAVHFIVSKSLPGDYNPGQYRLVQNFVINSATQRPLFRPPPPDRVESLMEEYVRWLNTPHEGMHPYYRAALAHLNFVAIHPFDDGNGRTARVLEALVLYLAGYKAIDLVSLEAYFGRDTRSYYSAIADSLGHDYEPENHDVTPWINYYLQAHAEQAASAVASVQLIRAQVFALSSAFFEQLTDGADQLLGLWIACREETIASGTYRESTGLGNQTAVKQLTHMVKSGLLVRRGRGRATHYIPSESVRQVYETAAAEDADSN